MKVERIKEFLNSARNNPAEAIKSLKMSVDNFLIAVIKAGHSYYLTELLKIDGIRVNAKVLIAACEAYSSRFSDLCEKAEINTAESEAVLLAAMKPASSNYLRSVLTIESVRVNARVLITACRASSPAFSDLCEKAEIKDVVESEAVLRAAIEKHNGANLRNLLTVKGIHVNAGILIAACNASSPAFSDLCGKAEIENVAESEAVLRAAIEKHNGAHLRSVLTIENVRVNARVLITACNASSPAFSALCEKAEIENVAESEAVLLTAIEKHNGAYLRNLLTVKGIHVNAGILIAACNASSPAFSDLCEKAEIKNAGECEVVLLAAIKKGDGAYLERLLTIKGMCVSAKVLIAACEAHSSRFSALCEKAEIKNAGECEAVLLAAIKTRSGNYPRNLLSIESVRVNARVLIAACDASSPAFSDLCEKAEINTAESEAVLLAAIKTHGSSYLKSLLSIEDVRVNAKVLIAACEAHSSQFSALCEKAEIKDVKEGNAVLIAAIDARYSDRLNDLLALKNISVTTPILRYALEKSNIASLYTLYRNIECKVDEAFEQEFNARVLKLFRERWENRTDYDICYNSNIDPKMIEKEVRFVFMGESYYDPKQLDEVCFNDLLLKQAREAGIFGKEFLKDCLWAQFQVRSQDSQLNDWLESGAFEELRDLLLLFEDRAALGMLLFACPVGDVGGSSEQIVVESDESQCTESNLAEEAEQEKIRQGSAPIKQVVSGSASQAMCDGFKYSANNLQVETFFSLTQESSSSSSIPSKRKEDSDVPSDQPNSQSTPAPQREVQSPDADNIGILWTIFNFVKDAVQCLLLSCLYILLCCCPAANDADVNHNCGFN